MLAEAFQQARRDRTAAHETLAYSRQASTAAGDSGIELESQVSRPNHHHHQHQQGPTPLGRGNRSRGAGYSEGMDRIAAASMLISSVQEPVHIW